MTMANIEETKINFFDYKRYEEQKQLFEKREDEQIIEARFDPLEWKQEVDRVFLDLANIEKELEVIKN